MQVLNLTVNEDGSISQFQPDFKIMRGSYRNILLNLRVPHSLLLDPVQDTEDGSNQTGNNVRISAVIRTATGQNLLTKKRYEFKRVKDYQKDGRWYRLYQRRMPKEFTMWETVNLLEAINSGVVEMITNVVNWTKTETGRKIEEVAASPIFTLDIYPSAFLDNAEEIEEPSNFDELHSQVQEIDAELQEIHSDLYGTPENNLGDYLINRLKAGNKITIEEDLTQLPNGKLKISVQEIRANEVPIDPIFELNAEDVQEALKQLSQRTDSTMVKSVTGESEELIDNADPLNPIVMHDVTKAEQSDFDELQEGFNTHKDDNSRHKTESDINAISQVVNKANQSDLNALGGRVEVIEGKIPTQANSTNQLADKEFVNSSIEQTAANRVTYTIIGEGFPTRNHLRTATTVYHAGAEYIPAQHDYALVLEDEDAPEPWTGGQTRYEYDGVSWVFAYGINNRPFTAAEIAVLNSNATSDIIAKVSNADTAPTANSQNMVTSGGVKEALDGKVDKTIEANKLYGTDGSGNQISYDKNSFMTEIEDESITLEKLDANLQDSINKANSAIQSIYIGEEEQEVDEDGVAHLDIPGSGVSQEEMEEYVAEAIDAAIGSAIGGAY